MKNIGNKNKDIQKAISFIDKIGVMIDTHPRHNVTMSIGDDVEKSGFVNPLYIRINTDEAIDLVARIRSLGFCGKRVIKALLAAIACLEPEEINDILNNFYIRSYSTKDIVDHFVETFTAYCIKANVRVSKSTIDKKFMRNVWVSFGRTRGLGYVFLTILKQEIAYFRDCRKAEEALGIAPVIEIQNTEIDKCSTCKHCKIDRVSGLKECKECFIDIPKHFNVEQLGELYPSIVIFDGILQSKYIIHSMSDCEYYKSRIGAVVRHNANVVNDEHITNII